MDGAYNGNFFGPAPWGLGEGSKGQILINFNNKVSFKEFLPNIVCVCTNERYKTYQTGDLGVRSKVKYH